MTQKYKVIWRKPDTTIHTRTRFKENYNTEKIQRKRGNKILTEACRSNFSKQEKMAACLYSSEKELKAVKYLYIHCFTSGCQIQKMY